MGHCYPHLNMSERGKVENWKHVTGVAFFSERQMGNKDVQRCRKLAYIAMEYIYLCIKNIDLPCF